jgi:hypothetical protein
MGATHLFIWHERLKFLFLLFARTAIRLIAPELLLFCPVLQLLSALFMKICEKISLVALSLFAFLLCRYLIAESTKIMCRKAIK